MKPVKFCTFGLDNVASKQSIGFFWEQPDEGRLATEVHLPKFTSSHVCVVQKSPNYEPIWLVNPDKVPARDPNNFERSVIFQSLFGKAAISFFFKKYLLKIYDNETSLRRQMETTGGKTDPV